MSNNTAQNMACYVVYVPHSSYAGTYDIRVSVNAFVDGLKGAIRGRKELQSHLKGEELFLYKPQGMPMSYRTRYHLALEWLRDHKEEKMGGSELLRDYFPTGPAATQSKTIDVIAITYSILNAVLTVPDGKSYLAKRRPKEDTQALVEETLAECDEKLRVYLTGPPWSDFWEAPSYVDEETRSFINGLKIPRVSEDPVLLLHNLENSVVDSTRVDLLFTQTPKLLFNAPGSGKTRWLLEGLVTRWGFYFTASVNNANHTPGSVDMQSTIEDRIPGSQGFTDNPDHNQDEALRLNYSISERRVQEILTARLLVFKRFLKIAQEMYPLQSMNEFKQHWLFIQLLPMEILCEDVFSQLSDVLWGAKDECLIEQYYGLYREVQALQEELGLDKMFYLILDEAQEANSRLQGCFSSTSWYENVTRPVLKPIVRTLRDRTRLPVIVSGASQSIHDAVNERYSASIGLRYGFGPICRTGAFDKQDQQREYILRYIPSRLAQTASGKALVSRMCKYASGRHRFTTDLLTLLLKSSFQSPHKILNAYIQTLCGFLPSDAQSFVEEEQDVDGIERISDSVVKPNFSKIREDPLQLLDVSQALLLLIMLRKSVKLSDRNMDDSRKALVELGIARVLDFDMSVVDENIVLLAAANEFLQNGFPLNVYRNGTPKYCSSYRSYFEVFVSYCLACSFDKKNRLCDIFDFGEHPPKFSEQPVELVSVAFTDHGVEATRFSWQNYEGEEAAIGFDAHGDGQRMMEWFKNPSSVVFYPRNDTNSGILLFVRVAGVILAIVVRCCSSSEKRYWSRETRGMPECLGDSLQYTRRDTAQAVEESALDLFKRLNGPDFSFSDAGSMEWDEWFQDGIPALTIVASYPACAPEISGKERYVALNMEKCQEVMDEKELFRRVLGSL